ncbi:hypothetical protein CDAR_482691 [Caerostris darwini]|uniref:Uncharacterized protein n=1 Tax=Caerostris darwini TaxID=1538125 RepID=A0AAV4RLZ8_9ARAC|nr:hypothetical protein CDAR_482691 [Caerostris darwini]
MCKALLCNFTCTVFNYLCFQNRTDIPITGCKGSSHSPTQKETRRLVNSCRSEQCTTKIAKLCSAPMSSVAKGLPITHVSQKGKLKLKIIGERPEMKGRWALFRRKASTPNYLGRCHPPFLLPFQSTQSGSGAVAKIIKSTEICREQIIIQIWNVKIC